ncbi:MAG TPA: hypothetical protein PLJ84_08580 [Bacteroidales bacterium]|nr:hypothetical protein [Bacteroidales bacterium]HPT02642.1 hypothetical protein [Bacteroidales bacterium]
MKVFVCPKKKPCFKWFLIIQVLISCQVANAQYYNLGQDPGSIQWRQIRLKNFRLVYPGEFESKAQRMANILECTFPLDTFSLTRPPSSIPVILHTSTVEPNAFTVWAPKRIEMYMCPSQQTYAQDWMEQLAIHEYRHAIQVSMLDQGFTRILSKITGEQALAAVLGLFIPTWFMEGDAVSVETAISHSGRGRVPSFEQAIRAQVMQKGIYTYDKAVFGSYKDYVPNQYELGYQIVANTRRLYGARSWEMVLSNVARKPYTIVPFDRSLKSVTGMGKKALYGQTLTYLDSLWRIQQSKTVLSERSPLPVKTAKTYSLYKYPQYVNDSVFIAERTTLDDISRFVLIDRAGKEKIIVTPGFFSADYFTVNSGFGTGYSLNKPGSFTADNISLVGGVLAWTEKSADPRWQQRNYSVIKVFDFKSGKTRQLTDRSRLFAPSISPDGKSMAAVRVTNHNICSVVILDMLTGDIMKVLCSSPDEFYMTPSWSPDGHMLVFTVLNNSGKSIRMLNVNTVTSRTIVKPGFTDIANPMIAGGYILYNGSYSGIENIYAVDTASGNRFRVTSAEFGACNASFNPHLNRIVYSEYSAGGYHPVESAFDPAGWKPLEEVQDNSVSLYKWLLPQESGVVDSSSIGNRVFDSEPYKKACHLFRFHSWAPAFIDFNSSYLNSGVSVASQNELSTATTLAGYDWDIAEGVGRYRLNFEYAGWYPVLDVSVTEGKRAAYEESDEGKSHRYTWRETSLNGGVKIPLCFIHGKYYSGLQPSVRTTWTNITHNTSADSGRISGTINTIDYRIYAYHYIKQASRDIYPRWGQAIDLNLRHSPFGANELGNITSAETFLFFPGILKHHGLRVYAGMQYRQEGDYSYSNLVNSPRGYNALKNNRMYSAGLTYKFPFLYPDYSAGDVAYFKRVKGALFYDLTYAGDAGRFDRYESTGAELTTDVYLFRFLFPFDLGTRIGYLPQKSEWFLDFLISVNFVL